VRHVLDNVGATLLAEAFALVTEGGVALSIGQARGAPDPQIGWRGSWVVREKYRYSSPFHARVSC
jgi:NADPH:quinone reductase-like Zn-dependent oxidoreductase